MFRRVALFLAAVAPAIAAAGPPAAAVVLGPGEPLSRALAEAVLLDSLGEGRGDGFELSLDAPALPLANRLTVPAEVSAERVRLDPRSGRLSALLVVSIDGEPRYRLAARGRARETVEVAVLARPLRPGEVVTAADLEWREVPASALATRDGIADPAALVGMEARRRLAPGRPLREGDVGPPLLVRRGDAVTMVFARGGLRLTALGRALEDGARGDPVRVLNADSRQRVEGVVTGPGRVDLDTGAIPGALPPGSGR